MLKRLCFILLNLISLLEVVSCDDCACTPGQSFDGVEEAFVDCPRDLDENSCAANCTTLVTFTYPMVARLSFVECDEYDALNYFYFVVDGDSDNPLKITQCEELPDPFNVFSSVRVGYYMTTTIVCPTIYINSDGAVSVDTSSTGSSSTFSSSSGTADFDSTTTSTTQDFTPTTTYSTKYTTQTTAGPTSTSTTRTSTTLMSTSSATTRRPTSTSTSTTSSPTTSSSTTTSTGPSTTTSTSTSTSTTSSPTTTTSTSPSTTTSPSTSTSTGPSTTTPTTTTTTTAPTDFNLANAKMDLILGVSVNFNPATWVNAMSFIQKLLAKFTFDAEHVLMTLFVFDSTGASGFAGTEPWSVYPAELDSILASLQLESAPSLVFSSIMQVLVPRMQQYDYRDNTQKMFIIFAENDAAAEGYLPVDCQDQINHFGVKTLLVNMDSRVLASNTSYPELSKLTGNGSNRQKWYDYMFLFDAAFNVDRVLEMNYLDGNNVCSMDSRTTQSNTTNTTMALSLPLVPAEYYCSFMDLWDNYTVSRPGNYFKVYMGGLSLIDEAVIQVYTDDELLTTVPEGVRNLNICCQVSHLLSIRFLSSYGLVSGGYRSTVIEFASQSECLS